jgi:hypothetical protein
MDLRDIHTMTREKANEVLTLWKLGIESYPRRVIDMALYVTGDLDEMP